MTDCAKKHMIYLIAWFLCMGFILLSNFSWIALGVLAALAIISLYKNVLRVKDKITKYVIFNIRYYIIISTLFIECIYLINNWKSFDFIYIGENFDSIIENALTQFLDFCQNNAVFVVSSCIISVILVIVRRKFEKYTFMHTLFEYQFVILLYSIIWAALFENADLNLAYILFAVVFTTGDLLHKVYDEGEKLVSKAGRR